MEENNVGIAELQEFVVKHCTVVGRIIRNVKDGGRYTRAEGLSDGLFAVFELRDAYDGARQIPDEFLDLSEAERKTVIDAGAAAFAEESGTAISDQALRIADHFVGLAVEMTNLIIR